MNREIDVIPYIDQEDDCKLSDMFEITSSSFSSESVNELVIDLSSYSLDSGPNQFDNDLDHFNKIVRLVYTRKLLVFNINMDLPSLVSKSTVSQTPSQVNFVLSTGEVLDVLVDLASRCQLSKTLFEKIHGYYILLQKYDGELFWNFDIYAPKSIISIVGSKLFPYSDSQIDITGNSYQFYKDWRKFTIEYVNGVSRAGIDYATFTKSIVDIKSHHHTPQLIWKLQPPIELVNTISERSKEVVSFSDEEKENRIMKRITLSKIEVSAIIGEHGTRINSIRSKSCCTVNVMPIDPEFQNLPRRDIRQQIEVSGSASNVELAIELMNDFLTRWKQSGKKYLA